MSSKPKVGDLVKKALELGVTDEATAKKLIKEKAVKSYKRLTEAVEASKNIKVLKAKKERKPGKVHEKGDRGWKYGPVWLGSIRDGKNRVAYKPANLPKLKETAENFGVEITDDMTQEEIIKAIGPALPAA